MKLHIYLILSFEIFTCCSHIGTNAIVFFHFPKNFARPYFQPEKTDSKEVNDEYHPLVPFPPFLSFFMHRNPDRYFNYWNKDDNAEKKENVTTHSTSTDKVQVMSADSSGSLNYKNINVTDTESHLSSIAPIPINLTTSLSEKSTKLSAETPNTYSEFSGRRHPFYPWRFGRFYSRFLANSWKNKQNRALTGENHTQQVNISSMAYNLTNTAENLTDRQGNEVQNCIYRGFISRYFLIWNVNWASMALHLTAILALSALVTVGIVFCCPYCTGDQSRSQPIKAAPMNV